MTGRNGLPPFVPGAEDHHGPGHAVLLEPISVRIATAVRLTGIGRSTLYELIASGQIETVKIGRSTFIPYRCLKRLIDGG